MRSLEFVYGLAFVYILYCLKHKNIVAFYKKWYNLNTDFSLRGEQNEYCYL